MCSSDLRSVRHPPLRPHVVFSTNDGRQTLLYARQSRNKNTKQRNRLDETWRELKRAKRGVPCWLQLRGSRDGGDHGVHWRKYAVQGPSGARSLPSPLRPASLDYKHTKLLTE